MALKVALRDPLDSYAGNRDFFPNKDRVLEALVYLMERRDNLSQYQIVKSVFLADRKHLNEVGRPVTFDNYVAMRQGPVPSLVYDLLKSVSTFAEIYKTDPPWSVTEKGPVKRFRAVRHHRRNILSDTDRECLDCGLDQVLKLSQQALEKLLHKDPGYAKAWKRKGTKRSVNIPAVTLLDHADDALIANLAYATRG
jgi:uncharacterized phage-associated protein